MALELWMYGTVLIIITDRQDESSSIKRHVMAFLNAKLSTVNLEKYSSFQEALITNVLDHAGCKPLHRQNLSSSKYRTT